MGRPRSIERKPQTRPGRRGTAKTTKKGGEPGADRVNLSNLAESLNQLDATSPQREERLKQLSAAYLSGKYEPNAEAVSSAMIDEAISQTGPAAR